MAEEGVAPHLTVGDDREPGGFLELDGLVDGPVLEPLERSWREASALDVPPRRDEVRRAQEASYDVATIGRHPPARPMPMIPGSITVHRGVVDGRGRDAVRVHGDVDQLAHIEVRRRSLRDDAGVHGQGHRRRRAKVRAAVERGRYLIPASRVHADPADVLIVDVNAKMTPAVAIDRRSEEHTSELQSHSDLVCRLLLEKKNKFTYK